MSKILAVFGATGSQGSSVITHVLNDPTLSKGFTIRALTRDPASTASQALVSQGIEVVQADATDHPSLESALTGVHTVFLMNAPVFGPNGYDEEYKIITSIANIAVAAKCSYLIFSTLPSISEISNGKFTTMTMFDAKAAAEKYIRGLPIPSAFFAGGFFTQNWHTQAFLGPQKVVDKDEWKIRRPARPNMKIPYLDAVADTGKYINAILSAPEAHVGKTLYAAQGMYTYPETAALISKASGKNVVYEQVSTEEFRESLGMVPDGPMKDLFVNAMQAQAEVEVFGEDTEEKIIEGQKEVGRLGTLGEYFERVGYRLE